MGKFNFILSLLILLEAGFAGAQFANTAFFRNRSSGFRFTTAAQNVYTDNCSEVVTIQTRNSAGIAINVTSNLTVNLSGTSGLTFYSDSGCTNAITTVTIVAGQSTASFYFLETTSGARETIVSATGYQSGSQKQTLTPNAYVWTGGGANANWNNTANWSGGAVPNSSQIAVFNSTCVTNCSPLINTNVDVNGLRMLSGYNGTITQGAGYTMMIRNKGWYQVSGNFVGSTSTNNINVTTSFEMTGGSFTSTAGVLSFWGSSNKIFFGNSVTFNSQLGTVQFDNCSSPTITPGNITLNNVTLVNGCNWSGSTLNGILKVAGNISVETSSYQGTFGYGGIINLSGNIYNKSTSWGIGATLRLVGGLGSSVSVRGTASGMGSLEIASLGTVTFVDRIRVVGDFTYTSGTIVIGTSTFEFDGNGTINAGSMQFYDVAISMGPYQYRTLNGTLVVGNDLYFSNYDTRNGFSGGTFEVQKSLRATNDNNWNIITPVVLKGSAARVISAPSSGFGNTSITVAVDSGTVVSLASTLLFAGGSRSFVVTSGSINQAGYNMDLRALSLNGNTLTRAGGSLTVNGVVVGAGTQSVHGGTVNP